MSSDSAARSTDEVPKPVLRRAVAASAIGNASEWFDYGLYANLTIILGAQFFPGQGEDANALTLLGLAISFVLRPLGGFVWGPLGDRLGRRRVLSVTIILMAVCTALIGVLPTAASVGVLAPILLFALRIVQGFSTGGEYGGAATFMAEYAPDRKRGFWGSFLEFGTLAGFAGGTLVVLAVRAIVGEAAMNDWGWRIPFLIALPLGLVGLYLRTRIDDTPIFRELEETGQKQEKASGPFAEMFRRYGKFIVPVIVVVVVIDVILGVTSQAWIFGQVVAVAIVLSLLLYPRYWKPILVLFALVTALNVINYTLLTYTSTYLQGTIGMEAGQAEILVVIGELAMMVVIPFAGALSDRIGRKPCWWISLIGVLVLAIPMFQLMSQGLGLAIVGFTVLGLVYVLQLGTISATFPAMFPTHIRYAGMAISYNVATAAFGGTAPYVNETVIAATGNNLFPAYYMMGACVIGLIAMPFLVETKGASLRGRETPRRPQLVES